MAAYKYTDNQTRFYFQYLDLGAGHTLEAVPGGSYEMQATVSGLPVPPADGRWAWDTPALPVLPEITVVKVMPAKPPTLDEDAKAALGVPEKAGE